MYFGTPTCTSYVRNRPETAYDNIFVDQIVFVCSFYANTDRKEKQEERRGPRRDDTRRENEKNTRVSNGPVSPSERKNFDKPRGGGFGRRRENESNDADNNNREERKSDPGERRTGGFGNRENRGERGGGFGGPRDEERGGGRGRGGRGRGGRGGFSRGRGRREFDRHSGSDRA